MFLIEADNLSKFFKKKQVLENISFQVPAGEIFAITGENGTGKTTLLKILATLILPSGGSAKVAGFDIVKQSMQVKATIGLVFEQSEGFYGRLTGRQNIEFFAGLYNLSRSAINKRIDELEDVFQVKKMLSFRVQEYSSGMKQRLALARVFLHSSKVLLLDEPTKELDEQTYKNFWQMLNSYVRNQQRAALIVTHKNEEANLANHILRLA